MKMPRHYAAAYLKAGDDKEKQKQALDGCPPEFHDAVKTLIRIERVRQEREGAAKLYG